MTVKAALPAGLCVLLAVGSPGDAAAQAAEVKVKQTLFRRSPTRDFVPERSFIVNRGAPLHAYQIKLEFDPAPKAPIDFQTFTCRAKRASAGAFQFAFRNQTIPARSESEFYFLIVPFGDVTSAWCRIGPWPATRRAPPGG